MKIETREARFTQWMREHVAVLHHVANAFAQGEDRNDLVQEISIALWRAIPAFRGDSRSSTFVYRVAHNTALSWHRSQRRHRRRVESAPEIGWMTEPEAGRRREVSLGRLEELYAAIRSLPKLDRSLILLSLDGLSYREIAEVHGLSESNVGSRLTRIRQRLAVLLTNPDKNEFGRSHQRLMVVDRQSTRS
jgi:RNA polymerase sigma-70 factor (ECF subfamily)